MHFIYIDDSGNENITLFVALAIKEENWQAAFQKIKKFRHSLKSKHGIPLYKELLAWKLVSGRGKISNTVINKTERVQIFNSILDATASYLKLEYLLLLMKNLTICVALKDY